MLSQEVIEGLQKHPQLYLGIDKVALSIPQIGNDDVIPAHELQCVIDNALPWVQKYHHKKKDGHSGISVAYKNDAGKRILTVTAGCIWGKRYAQYAFNPSKLSSDDWQQIACILQDQFEDGIFTLFEVGRVKTLEVYVDFLNVEMSSTVTLNTRCRAFKIYEGKFSVSDYSGKNTSALSLIAYNKRQQMLEREKIDIGHERTRVETRLHLPDMTFPDLATKGIVDPWASTYIASPEALERLCSPPNMGKGLCQLIHANGLNGAFKKANINQFARKAFINKLPEICVPQWQHQGEFWSVHEDMISRCIPVKVAWNLSLQSFNAPCMV